VAHELLSHTADLRAAVIAPDLARLYQSAADLVRDILVDGSPVEAREERTIATASGDAGGDAERFFRFVRELVFLYDAEGFLPARVASAGGPAPRVAGERFDPARHTSERAVKAVTRHGYRFERTPGGYRAELLFDL